MTVFKKQNKKKTLDKIVEEDISVEDMDIEVNSIQHFLSKNGLGNYLNKFVELGYDDLSFLRSRSQTQLNDILTTKIKMKMGHAEKLIWLLQNKKDTTMNCEKKTANKTYISCVIDRSGSMQTMGCEVVNGFNAFIQEQQEAKKCESGEEAGDAFVSLITFDNKIEIVHDGIKLDDVPLATSKTFQPRGSTALFDAIGQTIEMTQKKAKVNGCDKVIIVILTDGQENASKNWNNVRLKKTIKLMEDEHNWDFVFLAANQDAVTVGTNFGMKRSKCMTYGGDREGMKCAMLSVAQNCYRVRNCKEEWNFTPEQRHATKNSLFSAMPNLKTK